MNWLEASFTLYIEMKGGKGEKGYWMLDGEKFGVIFGGFGVFSFCPDGDLALKWGKLDSG